MEDVVLSDPEPLPAAGDFFTWGQEDNQSILRGMVDDIEALTEGGQQYIIRRLGHFCVENYRAGVPTVTDITLTFYGLYNGGQHYSKEVRKSFPPDDRSAEILIHESVTSGKERTESSKHYGIIKLGETCLRMVKKTSYGEGPDYFVYPSFEEIKAVNGYIQQLKPVPLQAD